MQGARPRGLAYYFTSPARDCTPKPHAPDPVAAPFKASAEKRPKKNFQRNHKQQPQERKSGKRITPQAKPAQSDNQ